MPEVRIEPVTVDNYIAVIDLRVGEDQREFVAPNVRSLADAWAYPTARPYAIVDGAEPVGFTLLYPSPDDSRTVTVVRFMIDHRFQGRGLGGAGLEAVLARARADGCQRVRLSVAPHNEVARRLYASAGFRETGEIDEGEIMLALEV
ncbi:spermidine acetyltransferase [Streptosporangium violaceochromogenes]|nr:spermidine acetyltransferase [Streptosporangium violaceochromogenes]